jgi:copper chaperone CopZ
MKSFRLFLSLVLLLSASAGLLRAEEQTATYRIIGLCFPERQADFRRVIKEVPEIELVDLQFDQAVATVRYDLDKLLPPGPPKKPADRGADKVLLKLNDLLRKASGGSFSFAAPSATPEDQLARVDIKVGLLDCKGCRYAVYLAVAKIDGVERATVSADMLSAWIDPVKTNRGALETALKKEQVPMLEAAP